MKLLYVFVVLLFIMTGCRRANYHDTVTQVTESFLSKDSITYKYVVLIPNSGCTGCISNAENFFLENVDNKDIKFVFTYIVSKKNLLLTLNKESLFENNVFLDTENDFYFPEFKESIYPIVFFIEKGKVIYISSVDGLSMELLKTNKLCL